MALFSKNPDKTLVSDRDAAKSNHDRLAARLTDAEANVIACKTASQTAALDGDDGSLDLAETAERAALHRLTSLRAAHGEAGKVLTALETQIAETTDKKVRTATAAATDELAAELIEAGAGYLASTALFNAVCARVKAVTMEANGLELFTASSQIEVSAAIPVVVECLRQHGRAVLNRLAPAEMPKPEPAPVKPVPVPAAKAPPVVTVFATKPLKWRNADGKQRSCGKCVDIDLPPETAERALACGAAVPLDNPLRKENLGQWPGHFSLAQCFDLDAAGTAAPQHAAITHSAFQVVDRGKPYALRVAGAK
jgi:hypothetical protein